MFYLMMKVNLLKDVLVLYKRVERRARLKTAAICDILYLFGQGNLYYQGKENGILTTDVATMSVLVS